MLNSFLRLRKFLGSQGRQFFRAGLARCQQRHDDPSSFFRHHITMGLRHFGDQSVRPQQPQLSSHCGHLTTLFSFVLGRRVEPSAHITVAQTVDGILTAVDDFFSRTISGLFNCTNAK